MFHKYRLHLAFRANYGSAIRFYKIRTIFTPFGHEMHLIRINGRQLIKFSSKLCGNYVSELSMLNICFNNFCLLEFIKLFLEQFKFVVRLYLMWSKWIFMLMFFISLFVFSSFIYYYIDYIWLLLFGYGFSCVGWKMINRKFDEMWVRVCGSFRLFSHIFSFISS